MEDSEFVWEYEGEQSWTPRNYNEEFKGLITAQEALQKSVNIPTAKIAQKIGLEGIQKNLSLAGIKSELPLVPSLSLGSAEVSPFEVATAYSTLARQGHWCELRSFLRIYDENGKVLKKNPIIEEERLNSDAVKQLVRVLQGVFTQGTAQSAKRYKLNLKGYAGKTGTTNDFRDAWFVGFSSKLLTLVWVGYDENESIELPGSAAALPIWSEFMEKAQVLYPNSDTHRK